MSWCFCTVSIPRLARNWHILVLHIVSSRMMRDFFFHAFSYKYTYWKYSYRRPFWAIWGLINKHGSAKSDINFTRKIIPKLCSSVYILNENLHWNVCLRAHIVRILVFFFFYSVSITPTLSVNLKCFLGDVVMDCTRKDLSSFFHFCFFIPRMQEI